MIFYEILVGSLGSLVASGIESAFEGKEDKDFEVKIRELHQKVEEDFCSRYPEFTLNDNFLSREENVEVLKQWILRGTGLKLPALNKKNYTEIEVEEEHVEYVRECILKRIKESNELRSMRQYNMIDEIHGKIISKQNIFRENTWSQKILNICTQLDYKFKQNLKISLWSKDTYLSEDYFLGDNLDNLILKLKKFLALWNIEVFNNISEFIKEKPDEALVCMTKKISPDLSVELFLFYEKKMKYTTNIIEFYDQKSKEYYLSIGELGLSGDYSDEKIFSCIMENLLTFLLLVYKIYENYFKIRNYNQKNFEVTNTMHEYIYDSFKWYLNKQNLPLIKMIFDKKTILDTELAELHSCDVNQLRKILFCFTSFFLTYNYFDNKSTKLSINHFYESTFEKYYNEIFGGLQK